MGNNKQQDEHNQGQQTGSEASWFDEIIERTNPFSSPEFQEGLDNGLANQPKEDQEDEDSQEE